MKKRNNTYMDVQNPQLVYSWKAPLRSYKKRGKWVLRFYLAVALLLSLIVFFFGDRILVIPIWAILFLFYALTITPPPETENKITVFGVETVGVNARWEALSHFYFIKRFDFEVLILVSRAPYFHHLYMIIPSLEVKNRVLHLLSEHIIYQEHPHISFVDRLIVWFSSLIPNDVEPDLSSSSQKQQETSPLFQKPAPNE